jgi:hypothetical protein
MKKVKDFSKALKVAAFGVLAMGLCLSLPKSADAVTTVSINGSTITVECEGSTDPACAGFTGGGAPGFPTSAGTLGDTADLYDINPSDPATEAQALDILIDGLDDDDFVTGTQTDAGGVDTLTFFSDAAYIVFKLGGGQLDGDYFFLALTTAGMVEITYYKNGQRSGGFSHYTEFGSTTQVPLPAALPMFLLALGGLLFTGRRGRAATA